VQRIGWSGFKNIEVITAAGGQLIPENYRDVTTGGVGLDYEVSPALTLRAGAQYDPTPTPGAGRSARVPDGNRWLIGAGASARITPAMTFDAALAYIDFQSSQINRQDLFFAGTPAAVTTNLNGRVEGRGLLLSLGLRSSF
jgi:long-chain fatty acid transport protein